VEKLMFAVPSKERLANEVELMMMFCVRRRLFSRISRCCGLGEKVVVVECCSAIEK
jgi:hypothetical protein